MPPENSAAPASTIPPDDSSRNLALRNPDAPSAEHLGIVGDTYTILLSAADTAGKYCLIDMHVPPNGGPPPHRHDFEETFILLIGELEATFRGQKRTVRAPETIHIPANAPHQFRNVSSAPARMLCICAPAGQEDFFREFGTVVSSRTIAPPALDPDAQAAFMKAALAAAPRYRTEFLKPAK